MRFTSEINGKTRPPTDEERADLLKALKRANGRRLLHFRPRTERDRVAATAEGGGGGVQPGAAVPVTTPAPPAAAKPATRRHGESE
jgi:hypothetical protein